jgi:glycosyltransferase involved in cell wall biosynthesis
MRILYCSRQYTTHDLRFLKRLAASPYEIHFLRLESGGTPLETRSLPPEVHVVEWNSDVRTPAGPDRWWRLLPHFEDAVQRVRPDLIHAGPVQSLGLLSAVIGFRPLLVASWGYDLLIDANRDAYWRWMTRYALERSDMLLCDSTTVRRAAQSITAYPDERIVQFPWGIDLDVFRPGDRRRAIRMRLGWEGQHVVLSTRTWEELYGIDVLLEAFFQAHKADQNLRLMLLATGSARDTVANFVARHQLEGVVHCPGQTPHPELVGYYEAADVYISCAHSDGSSISLLEALAMGLPVVVTDIPSNREWVVHGVNGWLGTDGDPASFASALLNAVHVGGAAKEQMGRRNRALAEDRANWSQNVEKLLAGYARLLGK